MSVCAAGALSGCMTTAFAPTSADVQTYAIKSVSVSGLAPQVVSEAVGGDLGSAIRSVPVKPGASAVQMVVSIPGFSGGRVANGYKAGADVTVSLKAAAGGKALQTATFHEDAVSADEVRASGQLASAITARVRRIFDLPASASASDSNVVHRTPQTKKATDSKAAAKDNAAADPALSSDALDTLMRAATGSDAQQDQTKTSSVPAGTVALPDTVCSGDTLTTCPNGSLLSGDFNLRR